MTRKKVHLPDDEAEKAFAKAKGQLMTETGNSSLTDGEAVRRLCEHYLQQVEG